jgi:hypothetical protein
LIANFNAKTTKTDDDKAKLRGYLDQIIQAIKNKSTIS